MEGKFFWLMLLLLLLVSQEETMMKRSEATACEAQSKLFSGSCFDNQNCGTICEKEGYLSGKCKGFRRRCMCFKDCDAGGGGGGGGGGSGGGSTPDPPDEPPESPPEEPEPPSTDP